MIEEQIKDQWVKASDRINLDMRKVDELVKQGIWTEDDLAKHGLRVVADPIIIIEEPIPEEPLSLDERVKRVLDISLKELKEALEGVK